MCYGIRVGISFVDTCPFEHASPVAQHSVVSKIWYLHSNKLDIYTLLVKVNEPLTRNEASIYHKEDQIQKNNFFLLLAIRSVERGNCPIAKSGVKYDVTVVLLDYSLGP